METPRRAWRPRRPNPVFTDEYRAIVEVVVQVRRAAGITQRELAARIGKAGSHVNMIERGQRRIDTLELYRMARAMAVDPSELFTRIVERLDRMGDG